MLIAVDFDGTIVEHRYPAIGRELPFATDTLRRLTADGHRLILWTVREGQLLDEALEWCKERGVTFYAVNRDYPEQEFGEGVARKIKVDRRPQSWRITRMGCDIRYDYSSNFIPRLSAGGHWSQS